MSSTRGMRVLVAEDDAPSSAVLVTRLRQWNFDPIAVPDGVAARALLESADPPPIALLDWMMPGLTGPQVISGARSHERSRTCYMILITARSQKEDLVSGLESGADDYIVKPYDHRELRARLGVARRVVELQRALADQVEQLQSALAHVNQLQGMLPICTFCKKIRDDSDYWHQVESYVALRSEATFSHGICPDCFDARYKHKLREMHSRLKKAVPDQD